MNKICSTLVAALLISAVPAMANVKMAVLDMQEVFKGYYKTEEADARIREQMSGFRKDRDERMEDYRKLVEQLNALRESAQDSSLSEAARRDREEAFAAKVNEARQREQQIREFEQTTQRLIQDQTQRMRQSIVGEIDEVVKEFAKGKYNLVFDKSGMTLNGTPAIIFSEGMTDITAEIVKLLNAKKP